LSFLRNYGVNAALHDEPKEAIPPYLDPKHLRPKHPRLIADSVPILT